MEIKVSDIKNDFQSAGLFESITGESAGFSRIAPVENCQKGDLVFLEKKEFLEAVVKSQPSVVVTTSELAGAVTEAMIPAVLVAKNVGLAHALLRQKYGDRNFREEAEWGKVHASAVVHPSVKLPASVIVHPGAVIGKNVQIGENTVIMANCVIEYDAKIGKDCVIYPGVYIGYECVVGDRVIIKPGSVIGSEGYGFAQDKEKKSHRIPQRGKVVLEDDVLVGASNCIDRASYGETRIGSGTKMDNLCHVAHNVTVGKDCLLTAGLVVAGSTKIGNRVIASGMTGILDHLVVGDDIILVHRAGVIASLKEPGVYAGLPAEPLVPYMKNIALQKKIPDMRKEIKELQKTVADLEKKIK